MKNFIHDYYGKYMVLRSAGFDVNVPLFLLKSAYYHLFSKNILAHHNTTILGIRRIETDGWLYVGISPSGYLNKHDRTFLNVRGKLVIQGTVSIYKGCRIFVAEGAVCTLKSCYITGLANLFVGHSLEIGKGSLIGWGSQILDHDAHSISYEGRQNRDPAIVIADHVWIGNHVYILKGVHIGHHSVIAANSVVTRSFEENNVLIAGNPAQIIIRRGIEWGVEWR